MNLGLRDAVALAEALAVALRDGSDHALEHYAVTRRAAAYKILQMTANLTRMAALKNGLAIKLRNRLVGFAMRWPVLRERVARTIAGFR